MRIIVLQLARIGDILLSWPTMAALKRKYPGAKIDWIVRESFAPAADLSGAADQVWRLPVADLLDTIDGTSEGNDQALMKLESFVEDCLKQPVDEVINLSFSPFSSYLTQVLGASAKSIIRGYTRHADGYLHIPDDPSAYFYAQVGVGRANRFHLFDVFAAVADVILQNEDYRVPDSVFDQTKDWRHQLGEFVLIQPGASQVEKCWPVFKWRQFLTGFLRQWPGQVVMIGGHEERERNRSILDGSGLERVQDLTGETSLKEVFQLVRQSELLIAGDTMSLHLASLLGRNCLNLSFASVNFWETGPRASRSRVLWASTPESLPSDQVIDHALGLLRNHEGMWPFIECDPESSPGYRLYGYPPSQFEWDLIRALYQGEALPPLPNELVAAGLNRIQEALHLALDQLGSASISDRGLKLIDYADQVLAIVEKSVPELRPLLRWFETERLRIPPGDAASVARLTRLTYTNLDLIISCYTGGSNLHPVSRGTHAESTMVE